jgi:hypothetical protein
MVARSMEQRIFISYASPDEAIAEQTREVLERNGFKCWLAPREIDAGSDWRASIMDALDASYLIVLVLSESANNSPHVSNEVLHAQNKGLHIVTLRLKDLEPSKELKYHIERYQMLDLFPPPVGDHLVSLVSVAEHYSGLLGREHTRRALTAEQLLKRSESLARQVLATGCPDNLANMWIYLRRDLQDDLIEWIRTEGDQFRVVVDGAGYGKTILLAQLVMELIDNDETLPIFLQCDNLILENNKLDYAIRQCLGLDGHGLEAYLDDLIDSGHTPVLMLDTLDLLPVEHHLQLIRLVNGCAGKPVKILGTCRPLQYRYLSEKAIQQTLGPFSRSEIGKILDNFRSKTKLDPPDLTDELEDLLRIPLHLRLYLEMFQSKHRIDELNFIDMFGHYWSQKVDNPHSRHALRKKLNDGERRALIDAKQLCIDAFLLLSFATNTGTLPVEEVRRKAMRLGAEIAQAGTERFIDDALQDLRDEAVFVNNGPTNVQFIHQFLMEFALAKEIIEPLMLRSHRDDEDRPSVPGRIERMLVERGCLSDRERTAGVLGGLRSVLGGSGRRKGAISRVRRIIRALMDMKEDYRYKAGAIVVALIMRKDDWGHEVADELANSGDPKLINLANEYMDTISKKSPGMLE